MTFAERLRELIQACFTGLWIQSHEHEDALREIAQLCRREQWRLAAWDLEQGLCGNGAGATGSNSPAADTRGADPLAALRAASGLASPDSSGLLVLTNFHRFLQSTEIIQAVVHQITAGKQQRTFVVILAPVVQIPPELEKLFVVVRHELPGREQLAQIARDIATADCELPTGPELERVLDAAAGLTRYEAEGAFSLSLVREGRIRPDTIWELKTQTLTKSGLLALHRGGERFAQLGGLDSLKAFCLRLLGRRALSVQAPRPRGVLLLGVPGTGKSAFCKALGNETGRPTLVLDVGSLMGSLVGQTEERTRQALQIVDAMAPCVLMIDEVEKALAGASSSGQTDSGISARLFGTVLSWLNDHQSDVFVVCTANDVSRLPPEFSRAERFDGIFFLDLPSREQKDEIWQLHAQSFQLETPQRRPADEQWTGAEIKSCCRLAALLDVPLIEAARNVVPIATTALESVDRLRSWASGRCLAVDRSGLYQREASAREASAREASAREASAHEASASTSPRRRLGRARPNSSDN